MEKRLDFTSYKHAKETIQYESFFFPELGNLNVTYEEYNGETHVVVSIDFPIDKLKIYDKQGNTRTIE
jgi:hypothetical protein